MWTNKGWVDGNGSNLGGGFGKPGGGRETHSVEEVLRGSSLSNEKKKFSGGATWVSVGDSTCADEEV
ncbi:hypothetical protein Tco_0032840 [Tanacetum coccineum]